MNTINLLESGASAGARPHVWTLSSRQPAKEVRPPSRDEVALQAYLIYVRQGCPQGRDVQHWLEAENQLMPT